MGGILPSNWFLVVIDNWELVEAKKLANLSVDCEVIACLIEEHVMFCSAELWSYSNLCWRVEHDAQKGIEHLSVFGVLPKIYHSIASFYIQQQKVIGKKEFVDMFFEIPLQLANNIVGFKHDESDFGVNLFEQLNFLQ